MSDEDKGIRRERNGDGFRYFNPAATRCRTKRRWSAFASSRSAGLDRGLDLPQGQRPPRRPGATRGRKQYRYHPQFREVRESTKYEHMMEFARALPAIRATLAGHMAMRGLPREGAGHGRPPAGDHADPHRQRRLCQGEPSYGLTTLRNPHVKVEGSELRFQFKGKSGKSWRLQVKDRRIAKIVRAARTCPGSACSSTRTRRARCATSAPPTSMPT